eukprot:gene12227-14318_t
MTTVTTHPPTIAEIGYPWKVLGGMLLTLLLTLSFLNSRTRKTMVSILKFMGVSVKRIPKVIKELKRKGFHFGGMIIPCLMGAITLGYFIWECLRLNVPMVRDFCQRMYGGILRDFCAALVGISYGRTRIVGRKSLEGTLAMFFVCLILSLVLFWRSNLGEQLAFYGSLAATLVELFNPSWVDDNLTIPCISGLVIQLISIRLGAEIPDHTLS